MENQTIRTFGRIRGKKLSARQDALVLDVLPKLLPNPNAESENRMAILEIGFGAGEHILQLAKMYPTAMITGCEPFINGVASLLSHMTNDDNTIKPEYQNIHIFPDDARKLLSPYDSSRLTPYENFIFNKIYVLHPDPWPKARHEKRRLLSSAFLTELSRHLKPHGNIIISTDHVPYFDWILEQIKSTKLKIINSDFSSPPETGLTDTRYEHKDMFGAGKNQYIVLGV